MASNAVFFFLWLSLVLLTCLLCLCLSTSLLSRELYSVWLIFGVLITPVCSYVLSESILCHVAQWFEVNPRRACAARVTVLGLSVCLSTRVLALQATRQPMSGTNGFWTTRSLILTWRFYWNDCVPEIWRENKRKSQRRVPMDKKLRKVCPQCSITVHMRRAVCGCGHAFHLNVKSTVWQYVASIETQKSTDTLNKANVRASVTPEQHL